MITQEEVLDFFKKTGAMMEGHFVLTSGFHSPHYFQCAKVLQHPEYNSIFAGAIAQHFKDKKPDVVISPAVGGIVFGTEVGRQLECRTIFVERENGVMSLRRGFEINENENVLVVEDVVTTGGSVLEVIETVKGFNGNIVGVGFIVDRSNGKVNFGYDQFCLASVEVIKFSEKDIPDWLSEIPVTKPGSRSLK